ncbi:hypothetical protein [Streptomyces chrestomyceticus]|uniref:hypothetical protein n=1 Tax=Streptomyces chrestomyceticus TaxID=68185 RepID=UPI00340765BE
MTITSAIVPLRPEALIDGVEDVVGQAWTVYSDVQDLARLGVDIAVTVTRGSITADLTVTPDAAGLLPALIRELENSGLSRTPGGARVVGTMCRGRVQIRITVDGRQVTVEEMEALVATVAAVVDIDFDAAHDATGQAA